MTPSPRRSIADYVRDFRGRGRDIAFVHPRGYRTARWTYLEVAETASRIARELGRRGVGKGDRVVLWGENCGEWVAAFFGCTLCGAVAVPLDRIGGADFARRAGREVSARIAFGSRDQVSHLDIPTIAFEDFSRVLDAHSPEPCDPPDLDNADVLEILFTSGATADPKGVVITHGNVLSNLAPIEREIAKYRTYARPFHPIRFLNLLPLSHVFGQFMGLFVPPLLGGTVLFQESLNPSAITRNILRERVSVLVAVPRVLQSLREQIEREYEAHGRLESLEAEMARAKNLKFTRRWWRFRRLHRRFGWKFWAMVSGGAALDPETEEFWSRLGFAVVQGYGLTETTSLVSVNHPFGVGRGSIGRVLPGREMKLDESGEILVRGHSVATAYWQAGGLKPISPDGWLRTGDLGALDTDGNLYFKGRKKNVIVTPEGMNVHPPDLEAALRAQHGIRDVVVLPWPRDGNAVPIAVLLLGDPMPDAAHIVAAANATLPGYQQIREWLVWPDEDFPRTGTLKPRTGLILERVLEEREADGDPAAAAGRPTTIEDLLEQVAGRSGAGLSALGSLERVELMSALEDRFQVDLDESKFTSATTLEELGKLVTEPEARRTDLVYPRWVWRWPVTWIRSFVYFALTWPATEILSRPAIRGRERLTGSEGPALVVSNHVTYLDAGLVLAALPQRLRRLAIAMEGERVRRMRHPPREWSWWDRLTGWAGYWLMTPLFHVFPLPQQSGFRESFRFAGETADRGYSVLVFPEGMRTPDGEIHAFRSGTGLLAANLGLPVIPVRIHGLWELKSSGRRGFAPWGSIQIHIGDPLHFDRGVDPDEITRKLEAAVRAL